jgi:hypothetical protein
MYQNLNSLLLKSFATQNFDEYSVFDTSYAYHTFNLHMNMLHSYPNVEEMIWHLNVSHVTNCEKLTVTVRYATNWKHMIFRV